NLNGASGTNTFATGLTIDTSDPSVSDGTPAALFQTQRWTPNPTMEWAFPLSSGDYQVRLYLAEIYTGANRVGARVFNVNVEGQALNNLDVYAAAGNKINKGIVKRFNIHLTDGTLNINFGHVTDNPAIEAI